jgi:Zn-dependent protease
VSSLRLATIAGIPVKVHWTFSLLVAYIAYMVYQEGLGSTQAFYFTLLVVSLFICVICHEYGHALVARHYGIPTRDIFILPIGGLARLEYLPPQPIREMIIAIAGPLVNVAIAALLIAILLLTGKFSSLAEITSLEELLTPWGMVYALVIINAMLFTFNLIPAYPMDGGRILRSALSMKWGKERATILASYLAQGIGLVFFLGGTYYGHMTLSLIGVFIFFSSRWERRALYLSKKRSQPAPPLIED